MLSAAIWVAQMSDSKLQQAKSLRILHFFVSIIPVSPFN